MGIFLTPLDCPPPTQASEKLAIALFAAIVVVVVGSLLGEAASLKDLITRSGPWFWVSSRGGSIWI